MSVTIIQGGLSNVQCAVKMQHVHKIPVTLCFKHFDIWLARSVHGSHLVV